MQTRLKTLQRLVSLYAAVEEMHSTELQRMTAAVREAQQAIGIEQGDTVALGAAMMPLGVLLNEPRGILHGSR